MEFQQRSVSNVVIKLAGTNGFCICYSTISKQARMLNYQ